MSFYNKKMYRLFLGLSLPKDVSESILMLSDGILHSDWVPSENYHITLRFFGDVDKATADDIVNTLDEMDFKPFTVQLSGCGVFPPKGPPRSLWVGLKKNAEIVQFRKKIDSTLRDLRLESDPRTFHPHVTISRFQEDRVSDLEVAQFLQKNYDFSSSIFEVTQYHLYSSKKSKHGSVYEQEVDFELTPPLIRDSSRQSGFDYFRNKHLKKT